MNFKRVTIENFNFMLIEKFIFEKKYESPSNTNGNVELTGKIRLSVRNYSENWIFVEHMDFNQTQVEKLNFC